MCAQQLVQLERKCMTKIEIQNAFLENTCNTCNTSLTKNEIQNVTSLAKSFAKTSRLSSLRIVALLGRLEPSKVLILE